MVNRNQLLGYPVLVILLLIPRYLKKYFMLYLYNDPLYLSNLKCMFGPLSLFDIIELHAFYVEHH